MQELPDLKMTITEAVAIKPNIIRFYIIVTMPNDDDLEEDSLIGEYEVVLDVQDYVQVSQPDIDGMVNIEVDVDRLTTTLMDKIKELELTNSIAQRISGLEWGIVVDEDFNSSSN